jgi:fructose-1,6-bisphosphatase/inositol monophosphatase family enzyme
VPVVKGAGGLITDWTGRELDADSDGSVLAAGDRAVHRAASAVLNGEDTRAPGRRRRLG